MITITAPGLSAQPATVPASLPSAVLNRGRPIVVIIAIVFVTVSCERLVRGPKPTNRDSPAVRSRSNHYQSPVVSDASSAAFENMRSWRSR